MPPLPVGLIAGVAGHVGWHNALHALNNGLDSGVQTLNGDITLGGDVIVKADAVFDVRGYTGYNPASGADNTAAITAAITAATPGGTVLLPPGIVGWTGDIGSPTIGIIGRGANKDSAGTTLKALSATARLKIGDRGGVASRPLRTGNFNINGNALATNPLYLGLVVEPLLESISIWNVPGIGLLIEEAQNGTFRDIHTIDCQHGLVFDYGTGAHTFYDFYANRCTVNHILFRQTGVATPDMYNSPWDIVFYSPYLEHWVAGCTDFVRHEAGRNNTLINPKFGLVQATAPVNAIHMTGVPTLPAVNIEMRVQSPKFLGDAGGNATAIRVSNGSLYLDGHATFNAIAEAQQLVGFIYRNRSQPVEDRRPATFNQLTGDTSLQTVDTPQRGCYFRLPDDFIPQLITQIRIDVGTTGGNMCVAVYSNKGSGISAAPDVRMATSGSVAVPAPGVSDVSLGTGAFVSPGDWFYLGAATGGATFRALGVSNTASTMYQGISGYVDSASHIAPSPAPAITHGLCRGFLMVGVP